jgi:hypothetical protein
VASRIKIATTACLLASGLFAAGASGAVAFAEPDPGAAPDSSASQPDKTIHHPLRQLLRTLMGQNPSAQPGVAPATPGTSGTGMATDLPPVSVVGDGRGGMPRSSSADSTTNGTDSKQSSDASPQGGAQGTAESGEQSAAGSGGTSQSGSTPTDPQGITPAVVDGQTAATDPTTTLTAAQTPAAAGAEQASLFSSPWFSVTLPSAGSVGALPLVGGAATVPSEVNLSLAPMLLDASTQLASLPQYLPIPDQLKAPIQQLTDVVTGLATAASQLPFALLTVTVNLQPTVGSSVAASTISGGGPFGQGGGVTLPAGPTAQFAPTVTDEGSTIPQVPPNSWISPPETPPTSSAGVDELKNAYRIGYTEYLRTAGTWKVAAVALPGVTGMVVLVGAGGLVGYRQARAVQTVRSSGTARFVT